MFETVNDNLILVRDKQGVAVGSIARESDNSIYYKLYANLGCRGKTDTIENAKTIMRGYMT